MVDCGATGTETIPAASEGAGPAIAVQVPSSLAGLIAAKGSITLDGARSWSTQDNQLTSQFYHVTVDDDFPYKL